MNKKIIFLDVDGTLVNENGIVPESAKIAVKNARKNGHYVFLCTGRSKAEIYEDIMEIGFDGIIAAAGGYIELGDKVLFHEIVSNEATKHVVEYFDKNNVDFYLESNGGLFASKNLKNHLLNIIFGDETMNAETRKELEKGMMPFINAMIENEDMIRDDINKISFLESKLPFEVIKKEFENEFNVIPCTVSVLVKIAENYQFPESTKQLQFKFYLTI